MSAHVPEPPRRPWAPAVLVLIVFLFLSGCADRPAAAPAAFPHGAAGPEAEGERAALAVPAVPRVVPQEIPGLGPATRDLIPSGALQAFVVTGEDADSNRSTAVLYARDSPAADWRPVTGLWPAHNGMQGWTGFHEAGDLRSPTGVYALTDAGGLLPDPGTLLPYDQHEYFATDGEGFFGESLEGSFDYVVAINYNRTPGMSPLDRTRPLGAERGGGIWIHVDHGGPTQGCVSVEEEHMEELLRTLDPAKQPVIVMGDATSLAR
ncbi:L,D-transpeptidase family protein [uncultured Streptomyces sp.]|uniref:L,D-transpeptidase family protein n=1 Tax=uncultured Streptomyces sp. TaxID=174707 RepID=UPI002634BD29|nr:L,D-transpeptidase family protein [uncultured Streptomyces sp.]